MFQKTIVEKYLSKADAILLKEKYDLFCSIFKNEKKIENIRNSKEEQYQEGFIRDLFVSVLGYTIKPDENYNILTELKNEVANKSNSKKSDGAICEENNEKKIRAVIELKGTDTTDLDKVAFQAFSYKNFHNECNYVIVSNFERLRMYVETQIEFEEFNLFNLSFERFCLLYLLLELNNLKSDIPLKLKHETISEEKQITDNFYADYSTFKRLLFEDLCENNPDTDKLLLFKKTQKLLDRILFILFCEDRNLLPPNSIAGIIDDYRKLKEMGYGQPLYNLFKTYFDRIDKGFKSETDSSKNIFAYNGGLFKTDEILDNIKVGDDVLYIHTKRLANYDFESQISVDILGRIFENSLTEIEEVQKEIEAEKTGVKVENNNVGKRKKDGVFYTPEYITKYIVENTIGKLCEEKRNEFTINDEEFSSEKSIKSGDDKKTVSAKQAVISELDKRLEAYRAWLLDLKILDPACGSGAFLNAALQQLKIEHTLIDYYWSNIHAGELNFTEIENTILENNLYGVDINEESVEIAKLSLWLHTAKKNRKLTTLNGKIKCGNSLIDDPAVAGEKAFNWEAEFPEVFAKGGFDVVIGNPPYVNINTMPQNHDFFKKKYDEIHTGYNDLMYYFLYKGLSLLNEKGLFGVITSNYFLGNEYAKKLRLFLNRKVERIVNFHNTMIFHDANVHTTLIFASKNPKTEIIEFYTRNEESPIKSINLDNSYSHSELKRNELTENWIIADDKDSVIIKKLNNGSVLLEEISEIEQGSKSGKNKIYTVTKEFSEEKKFEKELIRQNLKNSDIERYFFKDRGNVLIYTDNSTEIEKYQNIYNYLLENKEELSKRNEVAQGLYNWYRFDRPRNRKVFDAPEKLVVPYRAEHNRFAYDNKQFFNDGGDIRAIVITNKNYSIKYVLALLNSNLLDWHFGFIGKTKGKAREYFNIPLSQIPIKNISLEAQQPFINLADKMLVLNETFQKKCGNFIKVVKQTFALEKVSAKMESFYELDFDGFVKELKQKVTPKIKLEWLEVFEDTKKELLDLQKQIDSTDKEINSLVYQLYGLTDEEIAVVEGK